MEIYLVRHGETDWNREQKLQGWADLPLNANGIAAAEALSGTLAGVSFDLAFSSDLQRARRTAEIILKPHSGTGLRTTPLLRELNFGGLEGEHYSDARTNEASPLHPLFSTPYEYEPLGGGESLSDLNIRFGRFLEECLRPLEGEARRVLIAAHGIVVRNALISTGHYPKTDFWKLPVHNCAVNRLSFDGGKLRVISAPAVSDVWTP